MGFSAANYTELLASTLENIEASPVDQVMTLHPTLDLYAKEAESLTGESLRLNLVSAEEDDAVFTDASGTFSTSKSPDIVSVAKYDFSAPLVAKVRLEWYLLQQNSGKQAIVNLVETHLKAMRNRTAKKIATTLHTRASAGTVANLGTNTGPFFGLDHIVSDAAYDADPAGDSSVAEFTVGGIDAGGDSSHYWNASRLEVPLNHASMGTGEIRKAFRYVRNELQVNNDGDHKVTHIVAGRDIFEELEDSFDDKVRYVEFGEGQTRFRAILDGDIEVRLDPDCPDKRAYFLDINSWKFGYLNGNFMKIQEAQKIQGTFDYVTPIASVPVVGTRQRRANAVLLRPSTAGGDA